MNTMKARMFRILKIRDSFEGESLPKIHLSAPSREREEKLFFSFPRKKRNFPSSEKLQEITLSPGELPQQGWYVTHRKDHDCWGKVTRATSEAIEVSLFREVSLEISSHLRFLPPLKGGVVTVSDKGSRGERQDTSGPALEVFLKKLGVEVSRSIIVPDEKEKIREVLLDWTEHDDPCHLILLTGGTGLSSRDVTPEVLLEIGEKIIPGIGEYMRLSSAERNRRSILSRGLGVLRKKALLLCLPGSRRGALECLAAVAPALRHAVEIAQGWGGECGHDHS